MHAFRARYRCGRSPHSTEDSLIKILAYRILIDDRRRRLFSGVPFDSMKRWEMVATQDTWLPISGRDDEHNEPDGQSRMLTNGNGQE